MLSHPSFKRPACPVILVRGAPGSGKTTYARKNAGPDDLVIDLDDCFADVCGVHGHDAPTRFIEAALNLRNARIDALSAKTTGKAFVIAGCPTDREADWWVDALGCSVVTLLPPIFEIEGRNISASRKRLAATWYRKRLSDDWSAPVVPREVGADGY